MKTESEILSTANDCHPLAEVVINQLGGGVDAISQAIEAANHGADAGWSGFIYYADTVELFKANRLGIINCLKDLANDLGEGLLEMVAGFRCLKDLGLDVDDVAAAMYGHDQDDIQVRNALAWFALEEVGHALEGVVDPDELEALI